MKLYYGLTNYHLLCSILHKLKYNSNENTIFVASQGILKNRIEELKESNIFSEVYYLEDTNIRDSYFNKMNEFSTKEEIEEVTNSFIPSYETILPFNLDWFEDIYLAADHGVFGIYVLMKEHSYEYLEDGRGIYSNWHILDDLLRIKNPGIEIMSMYYKAYGKSNLIDKRFIAFDSQKVNCDLSNCIDFDINNLLDDISEKELNTILKIFGVKCFFDSDINKKALVLTQRFSTYKMLSEDDCILLYALLCDFFANDCKIYLKPHPADKCNYNNVFKNEILLDKEMPSELIRYIINDKFDVGISTYSSSIYSLKPYIIELYNIDETVVSFKNKIFKLYALFELAKKINGNVIVGKEILDSLFQKHYNLSNNKEYTFNYSSNNIQNDIKVSDVNFDGANYSIKIRKRKNNKDVLEESDILYIKIDDSIMNEEIVHFKLDKTLRISKVKVIVSIEKLY